MKYGNFGKKFEHNESPLVELQPEKTVFQGKILTLVCDIKKGAPEPTLTWEKDGNVLASNSKEGFETADDQGCPDRSIADRQSGHP